MNQFEDMEELLVEALELKEEGQEARKNAIKEDIEGFRDDFEENSLFLLETNNETRKELEKTSKELNVRESTIVEIVFNKAMSTISQSKKNIVETLIFRGEIDEETAKKYLPQEKVDVLSEASSWLLFYL